MKQIKNLVKGLVISGIAMAMMSTLVAQTPVDVTAKVVRIKGPARFTLGNGVWQPLKLGDVVKVGTVIQTGKDAGSFVDVVLGDAGAEVVRSAVFKPFLPTATMYYQGTSSSQNVVRIWQNSAVGLDKLTTLQTGAGPVTETQLDLKAGRISGTVKKMTPSSRYEIKLPNGVAGIRGTVYDITAEGLLRVVQGTVILSLVGSDGTPATVEVHANEQFDPTTGKVTTMSPAVQAALEKEVGAVRYITSTPTTTLSLDKTIYNNMSTTQGQNNNNQGQNNNNQGQNQP